MFERSKRFVMICAVASCPAATAAAAPKAGNTAPPATGKAPSTMTLQGGQDGTAFQSLTVQGEDRVHIEIERPKLDLALDPATAPGLDWGSAADVLDRTVPDGVAPFLAGSTSALSPYLARPWLRQFACGDVARFHPQVDQVERWKLTVVDAHARPVRSFQGDGAPPREIAWDGRSDTGQPAQPGLMYSYLFEARDRAGNKRNFVGEGFKVAAYAVQTPQGPVLAFTNPGPAPAAGSGVRGTAPIVLEAASWINQSAATPPLRVTATARSYEVANALATGIARALAPLVIGNPARIQTQVQVQPDAFEAGTVQIAPAP